MIEFIEWKYISTLFSEFLFVFKVGVQILKNLNSFVIKGDKKGVQK